MCLTLSPFIEVPVPGQESEPEWLCIFVGIDFASFYDFSSGFWKYSNSVVFFIFHCITLSIPVNLWELLVGRYPPYQLF
jgi:hypothetical protein